MRPLLVCGNANVETVFRLKDASLPVEGGFFPQAMTLNVSGVGVNVTRALHNLGSPLRFLTFAAQDDAGKLVRLALEGLEVHFAPTLATPQSLALVRPDGSHAFYRDLKETPSTPAPTELFLELLPGCAAAMITNIGWTRELLPLIRRAGVPVLADVQDITGPDDVYNQPFIQAADVLLCSEARLADPAQALLALRELSPARLLIAGLSQSGALLLERQSGELHHQPAFSVPAVFHGGAGDTLAAAFAHFYFSRELSVREALRLACAAAALKLRTAGTGEGHPSQEEVLRFAQSPAQ